MLNLEILDDLILEPGTKGLPLDAGPIRLADARRAGWRLHGSLELPAAVLRRSAIDNNADWMRRFIGQLSGVVLCPHGKTTMAPQLMDRQLRGGAWGMTCATIAHLQTYRRFGVRRILFANQIADAPAARWLAQELKDCPDFEFHIFVDSVAGADLLAAAARDVGLGRPINLLLEVGLAGGRTGVQAIGDALALARHVARSRQLALTGVATFEGVVPGRAEIDMEPHVEALFANTVEIAKAVAREALFHPEGPLILSAGGSRFFDLAAARFGDVDLGRELLVVLRSGCYISHDAHHYEGAFSRLLERRAVTPIAGRLENALEVWGRIQSHPEPERAYANIGKRDISHDVDLPHLLAWRHAKGVVDRQALGQIKVAKLSDQHAHLHLPATLQPQFGDSVALGVSHPCTTFDKWRFLFEVDEDNVVVDIIATFF